jgi:hypothetical protein
MPSETTIILTIVGVAGVVMYMKRSKEIKDNLSSMGPYRPHTPNGAGTFTNSQGAASAFLPYPSYSNQ